MYSKLNSKIISGSLYLMASFYAITGVSHLLKPDVFVKVIPPFLPYPFAIAILSGVAELLLAALLLPLETRRLAAWGVITLLVAVFPANIYMYMVRAAEFPDIPGWALLLRLPLQLGLIGWAYLYTRPGIAARNHGQIDLLLR